MRHPYDLRSHQRRHSAPSTNEPTLVTWIVATLFAFIFITAFVLPIAHQLAGGAR
jgi:hypothetical protein